ncbi:MAG: triose-phosphate isomerase [Nitrospiraceae bacterium]
MRQFLIAGNWKMNKTATEAVSLVDQLFSTLPQSQQQVELLVAPPFTALAAVQGRLAASRRPVTLAAQNVFWEDRGAFTGEISAPMLKDIGCAAALVGHSERRHLLGETDEVVNKKVHALLRHGLRVILCVGETKAERQAGQTDTVIERQLIAGLQQVAPEQRPQITIAYEPIWAIGTGDAATAEQATAVHRHIRTLIERTWSRDAAERLTILYGGSVTAANAGSFLASPQINGALVGGACLDPAAFAKIVEIAHSLAH